MSTIKYGRSSKGGSDIVATIYAGGKEAGKLVLDISDD
jgi:hypothetical protein